VHRDLASFTIELWRTFELALSAPRRARRQTRGEGRRTSSTKNVPTGVGSTVCADRPRSRPASLGHGPKE